MAIKCTLCCHLKEDSNHLMSSCLNLSIYQAKTQAKIKSLAGAHCQLSTVTLKSIQASLKCLWSMVRSISTQINSKISSKNIFAMSTNGFAIYTSMSEKLKCSISDNTKKKLNLLSPKSCNVFLPSRKIVLRKLKLKEKFKPRKTQMTTKIKNRTTLQMSQKVMALQTNGKSRANL